MLLSLAKAAAALASEADASTAEAPSAVVLASRSFLPPFLLSRSLCHSLPPIYLEEYVFWWHFFSGSELIIFFGGIFPTMRVSMWFVHINSDG